MTIYYVVMFKNFQRYMPIVEIIKDKTDVRCLEIYRLRHTVVVDQHNMKINPAHIFESSSGKMVCDDHDLSDATTHYAIRSPSTGKLVSAIRTVDANKTLIDMEKYKWFQLPQHVKQEGVVEWSRLVSDVSVRKTNAALLLYIQSVHHQQDNGIGNITFMVDSRAKNLMNYYKKWTICEEISNGPVNCDEYEIGRKSHVMLMPFGKNGSFERSKFNAAVRLPISIGVSFMKSVS